jgi:hypothetical protein
VRRPSRRRGPPPPTVAPLSVVKTGNFDVTVGGTLNVAADQENGTYTGTFSVDALYF